jgi:glycerol-3-phosphate dehydrogenase
MSRLGAGSFDLLVIGGGITGAGIARDAAMRGLRVALVEQGDFAGGTSSKTSKLIHGGLRYLEQGRLRLVWESLRERHLLRTIAPSVVLPLSLMLPVYEGDARSAATIRLGLLLYDLLAAGRGLLLHQMLTAHRARVVEPALEAEGLRAAGTYADCTMNDARLCLLNVLQAGSFGAVCGNYVRVPALLKAGGRIAGAAAEDLLTGRTVEVRATVVVNAAGPWGDEIRQFSDRRAAARLSPTKGIHLIVPRVSRHALFVQARSDRRMLFVLPWEHEYSLIGTTETPLRGRVEALRAEADEVAYLLEEIHRVLPGRHVAEDDVVATFAGARPLLGHRGASHEASREHRIEEDGAGLLSVLGGKFTTYRLIAQQAVDRVVARVGRANDRCLTDQVSLMEDLQPMTVDQWQGATRLISPEGLARLLLRYGAGTTGILRLIQRDPALAKEVCPHHDYLWAELVHGFLGEMACTISDVLARRTRIAWSSCQGLDGLSTFVQWLKRYVGGSSEVWNAQVEAYRQFLAQGLAFRKGRVPSVVGSAASSDDDE